MRIPQFTLISIAAIALSINHAGITAEPTLYQFPNLDKQIASIKAGLNERIAAVDAAIRQAARAGHLKTSTEAYYRDCLDYFRREDPHLPEIDKSYYPPRFDTSAEMEPINLAWTDLRSEVSRIAETGPALSMRTATALMDRVRETGRLAEAATDFEPVVSLIQKYRTIIDFSPARTTYSSSETSSGHFLALTEAMRDALGAQKARDFTRLSMIYQRMERPAYNYRAGYVQSLIEPVWNEFRTRVAAPFAAEEAAAERALEEAIMARKPSAELEAGLAKYLAALAFVDRLPRKSDGMPSGYGVPRPTSNSKTARFRWAIGILTALERGQRPSITKLGGEFASSSETVETNRQFRDFLEKLEEDRERGIREAGQAQQEQRRQAEAEAQKAERMKEAQALETARKEAQAQTAAIRDEVKKRISGIDSPEGALKLADELPALLQSSPERRSRGESSVEIDPQTMLSLQQELRSVANGWLAGSLSASVDQTGRYDRGLHAFSQEMRKVSELAQRNVLADRLVAPELKQSPLAQMPVRAAVEVLANQAAASGDWRRSHSLLSAAAGTALEPGRAERIQAIKSYLTAMNYEQAEQIPEAVAAYQAVLQQVAENIPVKEAGERLKSLRKSYPEAFSAAAPSIGSRQRDAAPGSVRPQTPRVPVENE